MELRNIFGKKSDKQIFSLLIVPNLEFVVPMSIDSNQMIEDLAEIGKLSFLKKNQDDKSENKENPKS